MPRKTAFMFGMFIMSALSLFAQNIKVLNKSDLQPIENVAIVGNTQTTTTDKNGNADITRFNQDEVITFNHLSFNSLKILKAEIIKQGNVVYLNEKVLILQEVVLSANKLIENKSDVPQKIEVITSKQISFSNSQTSGDLLQQTGTVFVQQSQMGGSSPVLRGFEANKVLLVIDGVRMNNAIYRSGHLQNVITIDPNMLDRAEINFGAGSVIYGSDAIGGVMAFFSKNPVLSETGTTFYKTNVFTRYSSANNEFSGNMNISIGFKKWAFLTSATYKKLGDLRMGNERDSKYGDWGKCMYYAERVNGKDSMMINENPNIQKNSGYTQYDLMQKILFQPSLTQKHILNFQLSNSGNVPRYDRLAEMDGAKLKYADWYYGPQTRIFAFYNAIFSSKTRLYDNASFIVAWQNISEDRINRKFNKAAESHQDETVNILSLNADFRKELVDKHELRYGIEAISNYVESEAYAINVNTDLKSYTIATRYPDNGSTYSSFAGYITHSWELSKKLILSQGLRLSHVALKSEYSDTMMKITKFPFDKTIQQNNSALNGNIGVVYMPGRNWRFALIGSSGFRAPNVDDAGKVNDSKAGSTLVIPNPELEPEYAYNIDFTVGKLLFERVFLEITGFYTLVSNAIVVKATKLNGLDSIMYDGKKTAVQSASNSGEAYVYGVQGQLTAQISNHFSLSGNLTYTYGRLKSGDVPLDHIPPVFGMVSMKYEIRKFKGEFYVRYNGWKHLADYSQSGEDNLQQATVEGMPSWFTLNTRAAYQINKNLSFQFGIENILDKHYRNFASGISAPGRNFMIALKASF